MGGTGSTLKSTTDIVQQSLTNVMQQSMSTASVKYDMVQGVELDCSHLSESYRICMAGLSPSNPDPNGYAATCNVPLTSCSLSNVNIENLVEFSANVEQITEVVQTASTNLGAEVKKELEQSNSGLKDLLSSSSVDSKLQILQSSISNSSSSIAQQASVVVQTTQTVRFIGGSGSYIQLKGSVDAVVNIILQTKAVQESMTALTAEVDEKMSQTNGGGVLRTVVGIAGSVVGVLMAVAIVVSVLRRRRRQASTDTNQGGITR